MIANEPSQPPRPEDPQPPCVDKSWIQVWRMVRTPVQLLATQLIAWALRRYFG